MARYHLYHTAKNLLYPKSYYGMLAALLLMEVSAPLTLHVVWGRVLLCMTMSAVLLLGSVSISHNKRTAGFAFLLACGAAIFWTMSSFFTGTTQLGIVLDGISDLIGVAFLAITAGAILRDVFNSDASGNTICGAVVVYMLAGLCFALLQLTILLFDPAAFSISEALRSQAGSMEIGSTSRFSLMLYFSFCTITTLGYGDITPIQPFARNFAWMEAVLGQLYVSILIARLVGLHIMKAGMATESEVVMEAESYGN